MHYKIASLILNSAKASGLSDVFVSQPDSLKESLAGKIFILAEINAKKNEGRKIFDFLVLALTDNYYNDEKILFRDKIEGLKLENIFEAAVAKTNKHFLDFLSAEKIRINHETSSITLGVVHENKLIFSNFGRNRALLVYRQPDKYELINVEASATEEPSDQEGESISKTRLFSSVINGEIPAASYFIFTNEALPEYLSGPEMINIITKLPPMTAAEQIKNILSKINNYIPFLGIIIKNTAGLASVSGEKAGENEEEFSSAHSSISSLNYTEQKTEQMLSPAGLINFSKIINKVKSLVSALLIPAPTPVSKSILHKKKSEDKDIQLGADNLGKINSLNSDLQNLRQDSFMIKDKMFFKKKKSHIGYAIHRLTKGFINWLDPRRWPIIIKAAKSWLKSFSKKNKFLFTTLTGMIILFICSTYYLSWRNNQAALEEQFRNQLATLETLEAQIDSYLLYNDQIAANRTMSEVTETLKALPQATEEQKQSYDRLVANFQEKQNKIFKIKKVDNPFLVSNLDGTNIQNLALASGKLYAAASDTVYEIVPGSTSTPKTVVSDAENLSRPYAEGNLIYFWDNNRVIQFNASSKSIVTRSFNQAQNSELTGFKVYSANNNLYSINKNNNQIFKFSSNGGNFGAKTDWLNEETDLSLASDLVVDGDIYILNSNGQVLKFRLNKSLKYDSLPITPELSSADQLIAGQEKLYFLDRQAKRLVTLNKSDGSLVQQYEISSLSDLKSFAIDESSQKAYILDNQAIYQINLN